MSRNYKTAVEASRSLIKYSSLGATTREALYLSRVSSGGTGASPRRPQSDEVARLITSTMDGGISARQLNRETMNWPLASDADNQDSLYFDPFVIEESNSMFTFPFRVIDLSNDNDTLINLLYGSEHPENIDDARRQPSTNNSNICLIQFRSKFYSFGTADESIFETFFNLIPPMEWSKCTPYVDLKFIFPNKAPTTNTESGTLLAPRVSNMVFINGQSYIDMLVVTDNHNDTNLNTSKSADFAMAQFSSLEDNFAHMEYVDRSAEARRIIDRESDESLQDAARFMLYSKFATAGMEIFTSPQTLIPAWEHYSSVDEVKNLGNIITPMRNTSGRGTGESVDPPSDFTIPFPGTYGSNRNAPIIDRMRPFMTLESISIDDVNTGHALITNRRLEIKFTLHDKSRLSEISDIISHVDGRGKTLLNLEWGWSHPEAYNSSIQDAPAPHFINALRDKQTFTVGTANYQFTEDGQVSITLRALPRGTNEVNQYRSTGLNSEIAEDFRQLRELATTVQQISRRLGGENSGFSSLANLDIIQSISSTNLSPLFKKEERDKINQFLQNTQNITDESVEELRATLNDIKARIGPRNGVNLFDSTTGRRNTQVPGRITRHINTQFAQIEQDLSNSTPDDDNVSHYRSENRDPKESVWNALFNATHLNPSSDNTDRLDEVLTQLNAYPENGFCSFGQLAAAFIGKPLREAQVADEIQIIFYNFSDRCSWMSDLNIANFPIRIDSEDSNKGIKDLWRKYRENKPEVTIANFFDMVNTMFIKNTASEAYGMSRFYQRDENGQAQRITITANDSNQQQVADFARESQEAINATLQEAYGSSSDLRFRLPRLEMKLESVTSDDGVDILRVHLHDRLATKYRTPTDIRNAADQNSLNTLRSSVVWAKDRIEESQNTADVTQEQRYAAWSGLFSNVLDISPMLERVAVDEPGITSDENFLRIRGGASVLKRYIKESMPSITIGTEASTINNFGLQTSTSDGAANASMARSMRQRSAGGLDDSPASNINLGLPTQYLPMKATFKTFGCPFLSAGQNFFIDAGTNTTADNVYIVHKVSHNINAGMIETNVELRYRDSYGTYRSPLESIRSISADLTELRSTRGQATVGDQFYAQGELQGQRVTRTKSRPASAAKLTPDLIQPGEPVPRRTPWRKLHPRHPARIQRILSQKFKPINQRSDSDIPNKDDQEYWKSSPKLRQFARTRVSANSKRLPSPSEGDQLSENSLWYKVYGPDAPSQPKRPPPTPTQRKLIELSERLGREQTRDGDDVISAETKAVLREPNPPNPGPGTKLPPGENITPIYE